MILQLYNKVPLSYYQGELFKVDVTCDTEGAHRKLMFKYKGDRNLTERGTYIRNCLAKHIHNNVCKSNNMISI